ncbi:MAG: (d)CMP kinase, partial [Planctomycetes bacterium]|nr:(d)CMP kinase [Planctomycetota bacterium]
MPTPSVIAIDGPVASGKTTVGRALAARLGYRFVDTGLMYRALTLVALRRGIDATDGAALGKLAAETEIGIMSGPGGGTQVHADGGEEAGPLPAIVVSLALGGVFSAIAGDRPPVPVPGQGSTAFWIGWSPMTALAILLYLGVVDDRKERLRYYWTAAAVIVAIGAAAALVAWNRVDQAATLKSVESNPLIAASGTGILAISFVAVLGLVAVALLVSLWMAVQRRRVEFAVLGAIGLTRRQILGVLALEYAIVGAVGVVAGIVVGQVVGRRMLSFLEVTEAGLPVEPGFVLETE